MGGGQKGGGDFVEDDDDDEDDQNSSRRRWMGSVGNGGTGFWTRIPAKIETPKKNA